ncbi:hypothetical protein Vafri_15791, partial [Volvox africanus]
MTWCRVSWISLPLSLSSSSACTPKDCVEPSGMTTRMQPPWPGSAAEAEPTAPRAAAVPPFSAPVLVAAAPQIRRFDTDALCESGRPKDGTCCGEVGLGAAADDKRDEMPVVVPLGVMP